MAFRHPTIESLATVIVEGEPEIDDAASDEDWSRKVDEDVDEHSHRRRRHPLPRRHEHAGRDVAGAARRAQDAITDLPEGRWEEFLSEPRIAERVAKARTRGGYLSDIKGFDAEFFALSKMEADNIDPQQRMALELTWEALGDARIPASSLRGQKVGVYIGSSNNDYQFLAVVGPDGRPSVRDHRHHQLDHRQPGVLLLRLPRTVDGHRHRLLELAGRRAPGRCRRCAPVRPTWRWWAGSTR